MKMGTSGYFAKKGAIGVKTESNVEGGLDSRDLLTKSPSGNPKLSVSGERGQTVKRTLVRSLEAHQ